MNAYPIEERQSHASQTVISGRSTIRLTTKTHSPDAVAPPAGLCQNHIQFLGVVRQPILRLLGFAKPSKDLLALPRRTVGKIHSPYGTEQPIHARTNSCRSSD